jgi:hypothetical protein
MRTSLTCDHNILVSEDADQAASEIRGRVLIARTEMELPATGLRLLRELDLVTEALEHLDRCDPASAKSVSFMQVRKRATRTEGDHDHGCCAHSFAGATFIESCAFGLIAPADRLSIWPS